MQLRQGPKQPAKQTVRIVGGLAGLFVVGLLVNGWFLANDEPVISTPNPALPRPNAYDFYVSASKAIVDTDRIFSTTMRTPYTGSRTLEQERIEQQSEATLQHNAAALRLLHQGFTYDCVAPPTPPFTFSPQFPHFAGFRSLTRLLFMQSRVRAARGNWGGASDSALDGIRVGEDSMQGGAFIAHLVGGACVAIGQRPMWTTVEHLNSAQSRTAALRLQAMMKRHFSYAETMQQEKWAGQARLKEAFHSVNIRSAFGDGNGFALDHAPLAQRVKTAGFLLYGKKRLVRDYTEYMDRASELSRQPYGLHLPPPPFPSDPINRTFLPIFTEARLKDVSTETQNGLLLVTLSLHTFHLEHGHYPNALAELAPSVLKKLPDDPFAARGTFKYKLQSRGYVLYSVGPDGKDDDGTPINDAKYVGVEGAKQRYSLKAGTRGDIVAGLNFP